NNIHPREVNVMEETTTNFEWAKLLNEALTKPGLISSAYSRFWRYSCGNQILALIQCHPRSIEPGPIATVPTWKEIGSDGNRGEQALTLCMPITHKFVERDIHTGEETERTWQTFVYKPHWFVLSQTEGADIQPEPVPTWSKQHALTVLNIQQIEFTALDGNMQGYAKGREFAINPVAALPIKTTFDELAALVLGHTAESILDGSEGTPRSLREAEAESVALICLESLGLDGPEFCCGYIQSWLAGQTMPERSAQKIFHAADQILKAGYPKKDEA